MIINHNMGAANAMRQMGVNQTNASKSMEKLSSGLRINKAGDDAAGLAISEKMRGQIRGLDQASRNAQDGVSMIQTAEGALNETHSILQRMKELATQASNDTNTTADRKEIQKEMNQLTAEITRIGEATEFNTQKLLKGGATTVAGTGAVGTPTNVAGNAASGTNAASAAIVGGITVTAAANGNTFDGYNITFADNSTEGITVDTATKAIVISLDISGGSGTDVSTLTATGTGAADFTFAGTEGTALASDTGSTTGGSTATAAQIGSTTFTISSALSAGDTLAVGGKTITSYADAAAKSAANSGAGDDYGVIATDSAADQAAAIRAMDFGTDVTATGSAAQIILTQNVAGTGNVTGPVVTQQTAGSAPTTSFTLQIGANQGQQFTVDINDMRASALGIAGTAGNAAAGVGTQTGDDVVGATFVGSDAANELTNETTNGERALDVSTSTKASAAIKVLDQAIESVSSERSRLGAYANRLEHTTNNLGTASENLTSAESRIRDVDMAKEMSTFSKNNILSQAAQAMLAQANSQPQQVLQLLR